MTGFVRATVSVDPEPDVVMPPVPVTVKVFADGVADPVSALKVVGTDDVAESVIEPAPFVTVMPVPAVIVDMTGVRPVLPMINWPLVIAPKDNSDDPSE